MGIRSTCAVAVAVALMSSSNLLADPLGDSGWSALPPFTLGSAEGGGTSVADDAGELTLASLYTPAPSPAPAAASDSGGGSNYIAFKIGPQWFSDDAGSSFDTGYYGELTYGTNIIGRILSTQASIGYGSNNNDTIAGADVVAQVVPFLVELRVGIPIAIVEPYGGIGIGGLYARADVKSPSPTGFDDDVVLAGSIFIGLNVVLGPFFAGLEGKYFLTDKSSAFDSDLNFGAVMLSLGVRF